MRAKNIKKIKSEKSVILSLPTKKEILQILKEENPIVNNNQKYSQLIFILEIKKVKENIGILKGEYYKNNKQEYRGSLLLPIGKNPTKPGIFDELNVGEYRFFGFTLDSREEKLPEKIVSFFRRSFDDATLQDFIPFVGGKKKNE